MRFSGETENEQEKKYECLLTEKPRKYIGFFHCKHLLSGIAKFRFSSRSSQKIIGLG